MTVRCPHKWIKAEGLCLAAICCTSCGTGVANRRNSQAITTFRASTIQLRLIPCHVCCRHPMFVTSVCHWLCHTICLEDPA
jgi:hypothetical protein